MICPVCKCGHSSVFDSRPSPDYIRRRRKCLKCGHAWTTYEFRAEVLNPKIIEYLPQFPHLGQSILDVKNTMVLLDAYLEKLKGAMGHFGQAKD